MQKTMRLLTIALFSTFFIGCSDNAQQQMLQRAVTIEAADECHLCGMLITRFHGPKGEVVRKDAPTVVKKFCSTRDMLSYYFEPENKRNVSQLFVHDMSKMPWDQLNDNHFIDGKLAWYVVGSSQHGAMGQTLASFAIQADAEAFAKQYGGQVVPFADLTMQHLL